MEAPFVYYRNVACKCEKTPIEDAIDVQCGNCISGYKRSARHPDCDCTQTETTLMICVECNNIRNNIQTLNDELDDVLFDLSRQIRRYDPEIDVMLNRLKQISIELRQLDRKLLEKI